MKKSILTICVWLCTLCVAWASDTTYFSLTQTEARFLEKNFSLLASKYNVDIANAVKKQAGLWANPYINIEQNIYNQYTNKAFDVSNTGQTAFQVQQLIYLAGKRNKRIQVQKYLVEASEYEFFDLMRTLRFELTNNFYSLYFTSQKRLALEKQIVPLSDLASKYEEQFQKGNVSLKEVARLKALLFKLETERLDFVNQEGDYRAALHTLLALPNDTVLKPIYKENTTAWLEKANLADIQNEAHVHRYDLLAVKSNIKAQEASYRLERANRVPDVSIGYAYDRAGSYIYNYNAVTLNFFLPVYDRNQNYVKIAKIRTEQSKLAYNQMSISVENEVAKSYEKLIQVDNTYKLLTRIC